MDHFSSAAAGRYRGASLFLLLLCALLLQASTSLFAQQAPAFSRIVIFGDSLSDDGNVKSRAESNYGISYPGPLFNYTSGRFTDGSDTFPSARLYFGTWHEQLARTFIFLKPAAPSLEGGSDYAFGGATTQNGSTVRSLFSVSDPFGSGPSFSIDNMGRQVNQYLGSHAADPNGLYVVWGGGNDLLDDHGAANVSATATRVSALVQRLASAGARKILVPNLPPLGEVPSKNGNAATAVDFDAASASYRALLNGALDSVAAAFAGQGITPRLYRPDIWSMSLRIGANPAAYGFTDVTHMSQGETVNPDKFLFWDGLHPTSAGHFQIAREANRALTGVGPLAKLANVSTRVEVGTGENVSIAGFVIAGTEPKRLIIRALGPSLSAYGVPGVLSDPKLALYNQAGTPLAANNNWRDTQATEIAASGLAPRNDLEAAIIRTLPPGSYTALMSGNNNATGIALAEVYDLAATAKSTLVNVSTRGFVGTGDQVMIGGFVVGAGDNPLIVVRALGPSLTPYGITNALQDPTLELRNGNGVLVAANDNWAQTQMSPLRASGLAPTRGSESAIIAALPPGNYTATARGKANTTGVALVEAYRIQ